jgi:hypothetical protein
MNQDKILVCSCSRDHLGTRNARSCVPYYLPVQKTLTVGAQGRGVCSMLSFEHYDGSFISIRYHHQWQELDCGGFTLGNIVHFGSLEFIVKCFSSLTLSPKGNDSSTIFMGMARHPCEPVLRTPPMSSIHLLAGGGGELRLPDLRKI